jgi:hypothetical protein
MAFNFHDNAAALILAAAKQSGLLDEVAEALCFLDKDPTQSDCGACELLSDLGAALRGTQKRSCGRTSTSRLRCIRQPCRHAPASTSTSSTTPRR